MGEAFIIVFSVCFYCYLDGLYTQRKRELDNQLAEIKAEKAALKGRYNEYY